VKFKQDCARIGQCKSSRVQPSYRARANFVHVENLCEKVGGLMENMLASHAPGSRGKLRIVSGWLDLNLVDAQSGEKFIQDY
jgi:hypothetical protein